MAQQSSNQISTADHLAGFASIIDVYEHRIGHATRAVAAQLPQLLADHIPPNPVILDNACGTGAVTDQLTKNFPSVRIYAADSVPPMIQAFKSLMTTNEKWKNDVVDVAIMDGQELRYDNDFFDADIMNFGIFFFPDPAKGAKEIYRTLKPGGIAIVTLWKEFGFKPILWEVQRRVNPANPLTELPLMEGWTDGERLKKSLKEGGFADTSIEMRTIEEGMWGIGLEDFQNVLLENFSAMVARNWTDEEKAQLAPVTAQVLKDSQSQFCIRSGDKIGVSMKAWAAVCTKPSA